MERSIAWKGQVAQDDVVLRATVERARACDADAWEALYRRVYPRLLAYARRRLATNEQAEEAVSETMVRAIAGIERFRWTPSGFDAWLFGILRNVVLETYRRRSDGGGPRVDDDVVVQLSEDGPLEHLLGREESAATRRAFHRLEPDDQEVLELRVVGGLDAIAAGHVLGKRPGAVRMAQSRALKRLRALLAEEGAES